ncbi:MAG TPA: PQQ-dependent sugar dehydrogenase [Acidimicrobiales bacterium]|nr:PQQ-dependent sugar dehydrogenase [Acidimicrobiales bacterium]
MHPTTLPPRRPARPRSARLAVAGLAVALAATGLAACEVTPPTLTARTLVSGLSNPWDLSFTPSGSLLWTERGGRIMRRQANGAVNRLAADMSDLFVSGETGLMGIAVDPRFARNRQVFTCQGWTDGAAVEVRVVRWRANDAGTALTRVSTVLSGLPSTSGRHGGCRLRFSPSGPLFVGTGDAAVGTNPQDLTSLGGKVLRIDPDTGAGVAGNPFASSPDVRTRRIWSYGHRNVQGLAIRPRDGSLWSAEHGPDRDDEVNRERTGNFGWNPVPGYDESVPMTDRAEFPGAVPAAWSSGFPTVATSGLAWLAGGRWEGWDDHLVVATLKGESVLVLRPQGDGTLAQVARLYQGTFGRIRTAQLGPDGLLYLTTANGSGDRIVRVTPS